MMAGIWNNRGRAGLPDTAGSRRSRRSAVEAAEARPAEDDQHLQDGGASRTHDVLLRVDELAVDIDGVRLLEGITFEARRGQAVSIMGRSGAGKSTLLTVLLGLAAPSEGQIALDGVEWCGGRAYRRQAAELAAMRRHSVGMVYQGGELFPELTASENVEIAGLLAGMDEDQARSRARVLLFELGVDPKTLAVSLSGGEVQRVSLARALVNRPSVLLADEPTGSLDTAARDEVCQLLFSSAATSDCALVLVTHDVVVADQADQQLVLVDGLLKTRPG